ncbi:hypothetical protein [Streptomyces natalensis]|uniref:hypothetical protein n=1 Tax=Streptomyces natalensis TaxID=68242 RepID=UPI000ABD1380|nr:hypothetical protein [Streptomyces natalensis]
MLLEECAKKRAKPGLVNIGQAAHGEPLPDVTHLLTSVELIAHGALDPFGDRPDDK